MKKYSILVPVYNVEDYLSKSIDSILRQDFSKDLYEVILVDDGSTDSSGYICDEYAERFSNVRVVHQENVGLLLARGNGVRESEGKYLLFLDSDDYVEENLLSTVDEYIEKFDPDYLGFGYYNEKKERLKRCQITDKEFEVVDKIEMINRFVASDRYNSIWNKVVRADIFRDHFDEIYSYKTNIGEDKLQTAYLLTYASNIILIQECLYHYVFRDTSIVHCKSEADIINSIYIGEKVEKILSEAINSSISSERIRHKITCSFRINTVNGIMDHIYKFDKRSDINREKKSLSLKKIHDENDSFFQDEMLSPLRMKPHNIVRYLLFVKKCYRWLVFLDELIGVVH